MKKLHIILFILLIILSSASNISASTRQYLPLKEKTEYYVPDVRAFNFLDLEGKGTLDLYAVRYGDKTYVNVYNESGDLLWNTWLTGMSAAACTGGVSERINLVYVDELNGNKDLDILTSSKVRSEKVTLDPFSFVERELDWIFLNHKLVERWEKRDFDGIATSIITYDLNGDGVKEILVSSSSGLIYVFDVYGSLLNTYSLDGTVYAIDAFDVDLDGSAEIAAGTYKSVYLLKGGKTKWTYLIDKQATSISTGIIFNGGEAKPAVIVSDGEKLYRFDLDGKLEWTIPAANIKDTVIADIDNDSSTEIIVGLEKTIRGYTTNGTIKWEYQLDDEISSLKLVSESLLGVGAVNRVYLLETDNGYVKNQSAYGLFSKAKSYYLSDNCVAAKTPALEALDIFTGINNTAGMLECDVIIKQCERDEATKELADEYYAMALKYYNDKDYESAGDYAEKAREIYMGIGYTYGVTWLCGALLDNITAETYQLKVSEGDKYYSDAYWAYSNDELRNSTELLDNARNTYLEINYSEGLDKAAALSILIEKKEKKKTADEMLGKAKETYEQGNYSETLPYAEQACSIYSELNLSDKFTESNNLKTNIQAYLQAQDYFKLAQENYKKGNYDNATYYATESKKIYDELSDYKKSSEMDLFMAETQKRIDENRMVEYLKIAGVAAFALTLTAGIFTVLKKKKRQ